MNDESRQQWQELKRWFRSILCIGVALFIVGGIGLLAVQVFARSWFIISYGIRLQTRATQVAALVTILGAFMTVLGSIPFIDERIRRYSQRRQVQAEAERRAQILREHAEGNDDPEIIREQLELLQDSVPLDVRSLLSEGLRHMDRIDSLQARQQRLIQNNDATYLDDTESALDEVEKRIWRNLRYIINLCIAADDPSQLDIRKLRSYLYDNGRKLDSTQELVKASAEWINQYESDRTSDRSKVESWLTTIHESLQKEDQ